MQSKVDGKTATASASAGSTASAAAAGSSGDKATTPADKKEKPRSERKRVRPITSMLVVSQLSTLLYKPSCKILIIEGLVSGP